MQIGIIISQPKLLYTWAIQLAPTKTDWDEFVGAQLQAAPTRYTYKCTVDRATTFVGSSCRCTLYVHTIKMHLQTRYLLFVGAFHIFVGA